MASFEKTVTGELVDEGEIVGKAEGESVCGGESEGVGVWVGVGVGFGDGEGEGVAV